MGLLGKLSSPRSPSHNVFLLPYLPAGLWPFLGLSGILRLLLQELSLFYSRDVNGLCLLYDLLHSPWLQALLKVSASCLFLLWLAKVSVQSFWSMYLSLVFLSLPVVLHWFHIFRLRSFLTVLIFFSFLFLGFIITDLLLQRAMGWHNTASASSPAFDSSLFCLGHFGWYSELCEVPALTCTKLWDRPPITAKQVC